MTWPHPEHHSFPWTASQLTRHHPGPMLPVRIVHLPGQVLPSITQPLSPMLHHQDGDRSANVMVVRVVLDGPMPSTQMSTPPPLRPLKARLTRAPPKDCPGPRSSHHSLPMSSRSLRTSGGVFGDRARHPLLHYTTSQLSMCFFIQLKGWFVTVGTEPWGAPREGASRAGRHWVFTPISA